MHVIYNGIDIEGYVKEDVKLNAPENSFVVRMVGRICKQKAPDIFVKMVSEVQKKTGNAYFAIVGNVVEGAAKERAEIEEMAEKLGVRLLITEWVYNPLAYMNKFDVGCLLSRWEGFGLAIPEYMITCIQAVAAKVDAIPYLIDDGRNGMLVEKDDWQSAAKAVVEIGRNEELRERLVKNGMKMALERFDAQRVSKVKNYMRCW